MRELSQHVIDRAKRLLPTHWPWEEGPTAKRLAYLLHVGVVIFAVAFAGWMAYFLMTGSPDVSTASRPAVTPESTGSPEPARAPLPFWMRALQAVGPLFAPIISYAVYYWLPSPPEPEEDEEQ